MLRAVGLLLVGSAVILVLIQALVAVWGGGWVTVDVGLVAEPLLQAASHASWFHGAEALPEFQPIMRSLMQVPMAAFCLVVGAALMVLVGAEPEH